MVVVRRTDDVETPRWATVDLHDFGEPPCLGRMQRRRSSFCIMASAWQAVSMVLLCVSLKAWLANLPYRTAKTQKTLDISGLSCD